MIPDKRATRGVKKDDTSGGSGQRFSFKPIKKSGDDEDDYAQPSKPAKKTERQRVRLKIASTTEIKRKRFLVDHKDYFLPLLPPHNHITKLIANDAEVQKIQQKTSVPYEELTEQPKGIRAVMKPYQLSGLSFLVYLYRNGLAGILGDEMGLGKTLQTIALAQYLKETEPASATPRPFLIVCPLSVLNTWITECKKWAPTLKVVRFHGVKSERDRVKKIATGELDFYGNETLRHKRALKKKRHAKKYGYDTDDSEDEDSDVEESEAQIDIIVTTYEQFKAEKGWFSTVYAWRYVVLDEGHQIKNEASQISKSLHSLQAEFRLILTGTPIQNNLGELWALLHWLYPEVFIENTQELFLESFNLTLGKLETSTLDSSRRLLELIMLRRMKKSPSVNLQLPEKTDVLLYIPLTPMQRFWYKRLITKAEDGLLDELFGDVKDKEQALVKNQTDVVDEALKAIAGDEEDSQDIEKTHRRVLQQALAQEAADVDNDKGTSAWKKLMNLMMQLRKVCSHPYLFYEPTLTTDYNEHLINASGKFIVLEKLLDKLVIKENKKIVIFSGFTTMLDLVSDFLYIRGGDGSKFETARIDGQVSSARRNLAMRLFQDETSTTKVMLLSTRAGGLGITLTAAADMVFLDADWNPQVTIQAEARCHRIGQTKLVTVYKVVSQGTVEEQMLGRIQKKLYLSSKVTESMRDIHTQGARDSKRGKIKPGQQADEDMPSMTTAELMSMMRRGASALSRPQIDAAEMIAWDWETTLAKCKDEPLDLSVKQDTVGDAQIDKEAAEKQWMQTMEQVQTTVFEGKTLDRKKKQTSSKKVMGLDFEEEFIASRADRRVGKNVTVEMEVDGLKIMVNKESMDCAWGEALPTIGGKDPRLAEPKKVKKERFTNQDYCQTCMDGGDIILCEKCPRAYHINCLTPQQKATAKSALGFICPQHECVGCQRKTVNCGGMLYRCRWCESAHCEECLNWDNTHLVGENLKEYRLLNYPHNNNAYYVECEHCVELLDKNPQWRKMIEAMAHEGDIRYEALLQKEKAAMEAEAAGTRELAAALPFDANRMLPSAPESLSDGMTVDDTPGTLTPKNGEVAYAMGVQLARKPANYKRKASSASGSEKSKKKVRVEVREVISLDSDDDDVKDLTTQEQHLSISD